MWTDEVKMNNDMLGFLVYMKEQEEKEKLELCENDDDENENDTSSECGRHQTEEEK